MISSFLLYSSQDIKAQTRVQGYVEKGGKTIQTSAIVSHKVQESYPSATVTVYQAGTTTLANIYSDTLLTSKSNPFTADLNAYYSFYALAGKYDIKFSGSGITTPFTLSDVSVFKDLMVTETDNAPSVGNITSIKFPIGTVTNNGDGSVTIGNFINTSLGWYDAKANCGMVGNGVTDDSSGLQACLNAIQSSAISSTIYFPASSGSYIIANALQDTVNSNSQIVLPKIANTLNVVVVRLLGASPASTIGIEPKGSIIESTLSNGTGGSIIGVANENSSFIVSGYKVSGISFHVENLTIRAPANPTMSGLNLSFVPNGVLRNVKIDTKSTGLAFPNVIAEPTTSSSYGLITPINNVPSNFILDNVQITGFYNGIKWGELVDAKTLTINFAKVGIEVNEAFHASKFDRILMTECKTYIKSIGGRNTINGDLISIEHDNAPTWAGSPWIDIDDSNHFLRGEAKVHMIESNVGVVHNLAQNGAFYFRTIYADGDENKLTAPITQATNNIDISVPNSVLTTIPFNEEFSDSFDSHSMTTNTHRITCKKVGVVSLEFSGQFATNTVGIRNVQLYKHTAAGQEVRLDYQNFNPIVGFPTTFKATAKSSCADPGDYFYVQLYQSSGGALNLLTSQLISPLFFDSPMFTMTQIR